VCVLPGGRPAAGAAERPEPGAAPKVGHLERTTVGKGAIADGRDGAPREVDPPHPSAVGKGAVAQVHERRAPGEVDGGERRASLKCGCADAPQRVAMVHTQLGKRGAPGKGAVAEHGHARRQLCAHERAEAGKGTGADALERNAPREVEPGQGLMARKAAVWHTGYGAIRDADVADSRAVELERPAAGASDQAEGDFRALAWMRLGGRPPLARGGGHGWLGVWSTRGTEPPPPPGGGGGQTR